MRERVVFEAVIFNASTEERRPEHKIAYSFMYISITNLVLVTVNH